MIKIPAVVDEDHTSHVHGGITLYRRPEGEQLTGSKPALRQIELTLTKLTGLCYLTEELLQDSVISAAALVNQLFPSAFAWQRDKDLIAGTGAGQPMGVLNAGCGIDVAIETGQAADTVVYENIVNMYSRQYYKGNSIWIANHNVLPQLMTMSLAVGTGGAAVWQPTNMAADAPNGTLMGRPIFYTEHCKTLGDLGDIMLVDPTQILVGEKAGEGIRTSQSIHLRFDYDEVAYKFAYRNDGQPWWRAALTPANGSTLSPIVRLAERA
jgi:HK97 family phage major capsid protein